MKIFLLAVIFLCGSVLHGLAQSATVIAEQANLRGTPTTAGKVVERLSQNTVVELIKQKGPWFLVQAKDFAGWVHGDTLKVDGPLNLEVIDSNSLTVAPAPVYVAPQRPVERQQTTRTPSSSRTYIRGPRGGCYYYSASGNKVYVDRGLCN